MHDECRCVVLGVPLAVMTAPAAGQLSESTIGVSPAHAKDVCALVLAGRG